MDGIFGSLVVIGILAYFFMKGSGSSSNSTTSTQSKAVPSPLNSSLFSNKSVKRDASYSTTGEFVRSTEGFIPTDRCECGGGWVKHVSKVTGGKFFGCSRFPECKNTRDKQQAKNFCGNGHRRTLENSAQNSDGSRRCLICRPLPQDRGGSGFNSPYTPAAPTQKREPMNLDKHCRNGHVRTSGNTYVRPDGERECKICRKNARS